MVTGTVAAADGDRLEVACAVSQDGREVISEGIAELALLGAGTDSGRIADRIRATARRPPQK